MKVYQVIEKVKGDPKPSIKQWLFSREEKARVFFDTLVKEDYEQADSSIEVSEEKMTGFDYQHCKGCGICAKVCPKKCIEMVKE